MIVIKISKFELPIDSKEFENVFKSVVNTRRRVSQTQFAPDFNEIFFKQKHGFNGKLENNQFKIQAIQQFSVKSLHQLIWEGSIVEKKKGILIQLKAGISVSFLILFSIAFLLVSYINFFVYDSPSLIFYLIPLGLYVFTFPKYLKRSEENIINTFTNAEYMKQNIDEGKVAILTSRVEQVKTKINYENVPSPLAGRFWFLGLVVAKFSICPSALPKNN
ncbi:hypothetical protein R9C00_13460 [Flammeovirgaceae bacterium SG7u.111]|nr:hypothetical protein [Flammeovirgaceae bacterium SG7u.132]WPO38465.1 hypothetical protein R9C00_13460 [Flammeovirgaceae bacterium SG7u.111]